MDAFSTVNLIMNLCTVVTDLWEQLRSIEVFKAAVAYTLVEDETAGTVGAAMEPLPDGFVEFNYSIIEGASHRADVSIAFAADHVVNFNLQVYPKEMFKKKAIDRTLKNMLLPYVVAKCNAEWEATPDGLVARDSKRGLVLFVRVNSSKPITVSVSIMAEEVAGI